MGTGADILSAGLSHHTTPVDVRERFALDEDGVRRHLARLREEGICAEALLVSTCNRVELYAIPAAGGAEGLRAWMERSHGAGADRYWTWRSGREAVVHLFRVASALDSLVLGEPQILGQVKDAVKLAEEGEALGRVLGGLARRTLSVAKRVRTETAIGRSRVGIGNAGVDLALQIFGDLKDRKALLIGAGEMGVQVAKALQDRGLAGLTVASRTRESAQAAIEGMRGSSAITLDRLDEALTTADIVVAASGGQHPLLGVEQIRRALKARRNAPLFLIDLAVPRNIDPGVGGLEEAYLFNIDDLTRVVEQGQSAREEASGDAQRIVEEEADRFLAALSEIEIGPVLGRVTRYAERVRAEEMARSRRLVDTLSADQRDQLDVMTRALVKKMLDAPLRAIRDAARSGDTDRVAALLAALDQEGG